AKYRTAGLLALPDGSQQSVQALPIESQSSTGSVVKMQPGTKQVDMIQDNAIWQVVYENTYQPGFYNVELVGIDDRQHEWLFAASVNTSEGNLAVVDRSLLASQLEGSNVSLVRSDAMPVLQVAAAQSQLWPMVMVLLAAVLCGELFLGWSLGRSRAVAPSGGNH
ncbi:MAG: hypothetical protein N2C12_18495, partial [Planctomycetales bacterium]